MPKASLKKEITAISENKIGQLAQITGATAASGVNIQAISAYAVGGRAYFRLITDDNAKAAEAIKSLGWELSEREVVAVELPDEVGQGKEMAEKLQQSGIDLGYVYGTTSAPGNTCILIFNSNDNNKAVEALA